MSSSKLGSLLGGGGVLILRMVYYIGDKKSPTYLWPKVILESTLGQGLSMGLGRGPNAAEPHGP